MAAPQAVEDVFDARTVTHLLASKYYLLASVVILYFDHFLTFDLEVKRMWRRPVTAPTVLFLLNRYYPPIVYTVVLISVFGPFWDVEYYRCEGFKSFPFTAALVSEAILGIIVILRLFALYGRSTKLLLLLLPLYTVQLMLGGWASDAVVRATGLPHGSGCIITVPDKLVDRFAWLWGAAAVFDTLVFGLTTYRTVMLRRSGLKMPLTDLFLRDGLVYFTVMFTAKLLNFLLFWTAVTSNFVTLNWTFNNVITVIMVNRLVLNLREEASKRALVTNKPLSAGASHMPDMDSLIVSLGQPVAISTSSDMKGLMTDEMDIEMQVLKDPV